MRVYLATNVRSRMAPTPIPESDAPSFAGAPPVGYVHEDAVGLLTLQLLQGRSEEVIRTIDRLMGALLEQEHHMEADDLQVLRRLAELDMPSETAGRLPPSVETALRFGLRILPTLKCLVSTHPVPIATGGQCAGSPLHQEASSPAAIDQHPPLSPRETDVLTLTGFGLPNKEIAGRLSISEGTVKKHQSHLFSKLQVRNRTEAVVKARQMGLI